MVIYLKNWFSRDLGANIRVFHLSENNSIAATVQKAVEIRHFKTTYQ